MLVDDTFNTKKVWNIPENKDASSVIIALSFDVGIGHQEHREDNNNDIPTWEDEPVYRVPIPISSRVTVQKTDTYVKVFATSPIFSGAYQAEKATIAGICSKQT